MDDLIDTKRGLQSASMFIDPHLYEVEMEKIFGRCWLFLTHESAIPNYGDFVTAKMGEDEVLVVRQADGTVKAFLNVCRHRGARVCPVEAGNRRAFVCSYHGWSYAADGSLATVPFEKELYGGKIDRCAHGLKEVAKVDSYRGFLFGNFDPGAISLEDYLGDVRWYLDIWMEASGGVELIGAPARSIVHCNWKAPTENFVGDAYHVGWTHASSLAVSRSMFSPMSGNQRLPPAGAGAQIATRFGHGLGILYDVNPGGQPAQTAEKILAWQATKKGKIAEKYGELKARFYGSHLNGSLFPNVSYLWGTNTFKIWQPRGPSETEVWTWAIAEKDTPEDLKRDIYNGVHGTFGTAGYWEADDNDNMESASLLPTGWQSRKLRLNAQMGIGNDTVMGEMPGVIGQAAIGETSYRGYYRFYDEILKLPSWDAFDLNDEGWKQQLIDADC